MRNPRPRLLPVLATALASAAALAGCGASSSAPEGSNAAETIASPSGMRGVSSLPPKLRERPAPRIRLADARGGTFDTRKLAGKPYAVTFLYAHCPDVCPLIGQEIQQALTKLGRAARGVAVVAVSVDPAGDDAQTVRAWLRNHREPANFHYLIGSERELEPVWKDWFAAPQIPGDPRSSHSAVVWLVDADGRRRGNISAGRPFDPSVLSDAFEKLLAER